MPIKNGKVATFTDIWNAILKYKPFPTVPNEDLVIHLPKAKENYRENLGRRNRAYIKQKSTGTILLAECSAWRLREEIQNGFKHDPEKKEGLFAQ